MSSEQIKRERRVTILLTEEEKVALEREAERLGLSYSGYMRTRLRGAEIQPSEGGAPEPATSQGANMHPPKAAQEADIRVLVAAHHGVVSVNELAEALRLEEGRVRRWAREHDVRRIGATFAFNLESALECMRELITRDAEDDDLNVEQPDAADVSEESLPPGSEYPRGLTVEEAAPLLRLSPDALWARLRRCEQDGTAHLGPGISAIRLGARTWRVFIDGEVEAGHRPAKIKPQPPSPSAARTVLGESELDNDYSAPYRVERKGERYTVVGIGEDWPEMERDIAVALRDAFTRAFKEGAKWRANEVRMALGLKKVSGFRNQGAP